MKIHTITKATILFLLAISTGCVSASTAKSETPQEKTKIDPLEQVLEQLHKTTDALKSYQGQIEYNFKQPSMFDSQDLRKGLLYYSKEGNQTKLRVNFLTRKQDEEEEHEYLEQYIVLDGASLSLPGRQLKGIWLVCIDYEIEELKYIQLAEPNEPNQPVDVLEMAAENMPIIGFTKIENLKKQFDVSLVEQEKADSKDFIQVHLQVKPNSVYIDDYTYIDIFIDRKIYLPAEIIAHTTEEDIYEIKFLKPIINKAIDKKVFDFKIPKGFGEPVIMPLKEKEAQ